MKKIRLYNPTNSDFETTYDTNGDGNPQTFILHAQEIESFEEPVAIHIKNHLAYQIARQNQGQQSYDIALKKAEDLITVTDETFD